ncbi:MAG TPA: helix-turn-helix transcriptional regulator [Pyrinomonadaceae bacterium]
MDRRIERVINKMESDPASCTPSALAASIRLSESRFRHLFKQETGMTPAQYLKLVRLKKAALLLTTTYNSIKAILIKVGLTSHTHFIRDFRQLYGMSPTEYRNLQRK